MPQNNQTNSMGLAGFIVSLVGIITCAPLCIIGAILSLIGLGKEPRGFAIAGLIIGLIGSLLSVLLLVFIALLGVGAVASMAGVLSLLPPEFQAEFELGLISIEVEAYNFDNNTLPQDLQSLNLSDMLKEDPWGNPYSYERHSSGASYVISSAGEDGQLGTSDDIKYDSIAQSP